MRPKPKKTPEEWVAQNRTYPPESDTPGPRDIGRTQYMRIIHAFFDNVTDSARGPASHLAWASKYQVCVFVTSTQVGKTDASLDVLGWRFATRPRPSLYVGPSEKFILETINERLERMLKESPTLSVDEMRSTKRIKIVNGIKLRLAWGGSPSSLASDQAGDVIVDEYDKMFSAQRQMGDPYELAKARGDTYADRKMLVTSTPSQGKVATEVDPKTGLEFWAVVDKNMVESHLKSRIWRRWQTGTRHHAAWQCPDCKSWFIPRMKNLSWKKDASSGEMLTNTWLECPVSGCVIEEVSKDAMNAGVVFVAPGQNIRFDGTVEGDPVSTEVLSVWVSGLMSPFVSWGKRAAELESAKISGEPEAIQGVMNNAGEAWSPIDVKQLTVDDVQKKVVNYNFGYVPHDVLRVTLGCDVQKLKMVIVVRGWGAAARSWLLETKEFHGPTNETEVWAKLSLMLLKTYGGLRIDKALIDAGFRPDKREAGDYHRVLDFCRRHAWVAMATRGRSKQSVPLIQKHEEVTAEGKSEKYGLDTLTVDTDYFKSMWFSRLHMKPGDIGSAHLPIDVDPEYCRQIISEIRGDDGKWHKVYPHNHFLDAEVMAAVAAYMLRVQNIPEGTIRDSEIDDIVGPDVPAPMIAAKSLAQRMADMSASFNQR